MKKYFSSCIIAILAYAFAQQADAQGYYLYKNGAKQTIHSSQMDSLVFFKTEQAEEPTPDDPGPDDPDNPKAAKAASPTTAKRNQEWYTRLDFEDDTELEKPSEVSSRPPRTSTSPTRPARCGAWLISSS